MINPMNAKISHGSSVRESTKCVKKANSQEWGSKVTRSQRTSKVSALSESANEFSYTKRSEVKGANKVSSKKCATAISERYESTEYVKKNVSTKTCQQN